MITFMKKNIIALITLVVVVVVAMNAQHAFAAVQIQPPSVVSAAADDIRIQVTLVGPSRAAVESYAPTQGGVTVKTYNQFSSTPVDVQSLGFVAGVLDTADYPHQYALRYDFSFTSGQFTSGNQYSYEVDGGTPGNGTVTVLSSGNHFLATDPGSYNGGGGQSNSSPSIGLTPVVTDTTAVITLSVNGTVTTTFDFLLKYKKTSGGATMNANGTCHFDSVDQKFDSTNNSSNTNLSTCDFLIASLSAGTQYTYTLVSNPAVSAVWQGTFTTTGGNGNQGASGGTVTAEFSKICAPGTTGSITGTLASNPPSNATIDLYAAPDGQSLVNVGTAFSGDIPADGASFQANIQNLVHNALYNFSLKDHQTGAVIASDTFTVGQQDDQAASANGANDCGGVTPPPVNSSGSNCGTAVTSTTTIGLSASDLCQSYATLEGNPTQNANGTWTWTCSNTGLGTNSTCSTVASNTQECGTADGTVSASVPATNTLCKSWATLDAAPTQQTTGPESGTWGWSCTDQGTGQTSTCGTSPIGSQGTGSNTCGAADGTVYVAATPPPDANLCPQYSTHSTPTQDTDNTWTWTCTDSLGDAPLTCGTDASASTTNTPSQTTGLQNPFRTLDSFPKILAAIMNNIVLPIAVPFIAVMIMYSGFLFIIAREKGSVVKLAEAKKTFLYTMIGAAIVLGAFVIGNAIQGTVNAITSMVFHISTIV